MISVAETGTIVVGGTDCGLSSSNAMTAGTNTVTLTTSGDKAYTCTITFTDSVTNTAGALTLTEFLLDTTVAAATETTAVVTTCSSACYYTIATKDSTPDVVISVAETGTIVVGGTSGCGLTSTNAMTAGSNTVTLALTGTESVTNTALPRYICTITFTDSAGNAAGALTLTEFLLDTTVAAATESTPVVATCSSACYYTIATKDSTPDVVISVAETGTIAVGGTSGCGLSSSNAMTAGTNTVTLALTGRACDNTALPRYTCTITFTDSVTNTAGALTLTEFLLDTTVAAATESTPVVATCSSHAIMPLRRRTRHRML